jgi:WD40 repeat protein
MSRSEQSIPSMQRDIFISHSSLDYDKAKVIQGHLKQEGYTCWVAPDDVQTDTFWAEQIVTAINSSKVLLLVLSSHANDSLNVSREVALAADKIPMVTARIEDVRPAGALQYFLTLIHWIDLFPEPVDPHLGKVKNAVSLLLSDESARSQAASISHSLEGHTAAVTSFSPGGGQIVSATNDGVHIWDVKTMLELATLKGHTRPTRACAFSPDGKMVASASLDNTVRLWDAKTGYEKAVLSGHTGGVNSCSFSPDASLLVSGGQDSSAKLWDIERGEQRMTITGHADSVNCCFFSPDGRTMITGSADRTLRLCDVATGRVVGSLEGHVAPVNAGDFSPDGKLILSGGSDGLFKLWSREGEELASHAGHADSLNACVFSPNGKMIASASQDSTIKIFGGE